MDSQEKDQSKIRQREEMLARRVGEALDRLKQHEAAECPDAEIVAAYSEQALGAEERERWENHFAKCARCRKILRVLAASSDAPLAEKEVGRLGELVSTVAAPVEVTNRVAGRARPGRVDWRARWLAPALGVAAVLAVWFAMRPPWRANDRGASGTLIAQAPKQEAPLSPPAAEADRLSREAPKLDLKNSPAPPPNDSSIRVPAQNAPARTRAKGRADAASTEDKITGGASGATNSLQQEKKLDAQQQELEARPSAGLATPPLPATQATMEAPPPPQSNAKAAPRAAAPGPAQAEASANATGNPAVGNNRSPAPQRAARALALPEVLPPGAANAQSSTSITAFKSAEAATVQATAPFGSIVWRMGKVGRIERSADGGETWVPQTSPSKEDWLAAVAVSDTVCWTAGRNGAIARTTDGENWERVAPPVQAAGGDGKLPDWSGITAINAMSATVTTSDGRKFSTADGGKAWRAQ